VPKNLTQFFFILFLCIISAVLAVFLPNASLFVIIGAVIIWLLSYKPAVGLYVLLFLYPFLGWSIDFGAYELTRATPWISSINAPIADFWAIALIVATCVYFVREQSCGRDVLKKVGFLTIQFFQLLMGIFNGLLLPSNILSL